MRDDNCAADQKTNHEWPNPRPPHLKAKGDRSANVAAQHALALDQAMPELPGDVHAHPRPDVAAHPRPLLRFLAQAPLLSTKKRAYKAKKGLRGSAGSRNPPVHTELSTPRAPNPMTAKQQAAGGRTSRKTLGPQAVAKVPKWLPCARHAAF